MARVALSYGHGSNTWEDKHSKGVVVGGNVYEEHTFNATVGEKVRKIIEAHGVSVLVVQPPLGRDVDLQTRTDKANAWKADLYYSIHSNAEKPSVRGYTAFYSSTSASSKKVAELYAKYAKEAGFPLYHDGAYPSVSGTWNDFHELRVTKMPAVLTENGFMTNPADFKQIFLNEGNAHDKLARVHAKTILEYFKIKYDPVKAGETKPFKNPVDPPVKNPVDKAAIYRVIVDGTQEGAYGDFHNILDEVAAAIGKDSKKITIERV